MVPQVGHRRVPQFKPWEVWQIVAPPLTEESLFIQRLSGVWIDQQSLLNAAYGDDGCYDLKQGCW